MPGTKGLKRKLGDVTKWLESTKKRKKGKQSKPEISYRTSHNGLINRLLLLYKKKFNNVMHSRIAPLNEKQRVEKPLFCFFLWGNYYLP